MIDVKLMRVGGGEDFELPAYATSGAAGLDLRAAQTVTLKSGSRFLMSTGIAIALPPLHEAQVRPRSGLAVKHGVTVLNSPGTIDEDYRGEIKVILINHGAEDFVINRGDRIAQLVIAAVTKVHLVEVQALNETARGVGGHGSTGTS